MPVTDDPDHFEVPARVVWLGDKPLVEMRRIGRAALAQAFWDYVVAGAPIAAVLPLDEQPLPRGSGPLRGAIFHTYRCGSTLLCRQMSVLPGVYAAAEPSFLNQLVLGGHQDLPVLRARILKILALQARGLGKRDIIVKWPGLLADRAAALVAALPDVPMVFLHRDPVEVLASIARAPLGNTQGAPETVGLSMPAREVGETARAAVLIAHLCRRVAAVPSLRRIDYATLDPARIARHFGLTVSDAEVAAIAEAGAWHSKSQPGKVAFVNDSATRQAEASSEVRRLAAAYLTPALAVATATLAEL